MTDLGLDRYAPGSCGNARRVRRSAANPGAALTSVSSKAGSRLASLGREVHVDCLAAVLPAHLT